MTLEEPAVEALLEEAIARNDGKAPTTGRGTLIVRPSRKERKEGS